MLSRSQREKGGTEHVEIVSSVSPSTVVLLKAPLHLSTCWWLQQHCYFVAKSCLALLRTAGRQSLCPWDFPGENTGVGCHFLLQGIFLTQGSSPHLLHCQADAFPLRLQGSPIMAFGLPILREENSCSTFTEIFSAQIFDYLKVAFKTLLRCLLGHWPILLTGTYKSYWASLVAQRVKHLPTMRETWVQSLG